MNGSQSHRPPPLPPVVYYYFFCRLFSAYSYYGIAFAVQELSGNLYLNLFLLSIVDFPSNLLNIFFNYW